MAADMLACRESLTLDGKRTPVFKIYDYRKCYQPGGSNAREFIVQTFEQFLASEELNNGCMNSMRKFLVFLPLR